MWDMNLKYELNIGLLLFSSMVTLCILIGILLENRRNKPFMGSFVKLLIANIVMQLAEIGIWSVEAAGGNKVLSIIFSFISYGSGTILIAIYAYCLIGIVREKKQVSYLPAHIILAANLINLILIFISIFNGMIFTVNSKGMFMDGPLAIVSWIFDICGLIAEVLIILYYRKYMGKKSVMCLLSFCLMVFPTLLIQDIWYPVPEMLATTLALIFIFLLFYGEMTSQLIEKEKMLAESRVAITISQIQPHFIYNTLSTIGELCELNPKLAEEVTNNFAQYLRGNLDNMSETRPISFAKELEHVRTYLWLEKMRFQEDLNVVYDIQADNFLIPSLSVQPLVENAVKHGMMGKEGEFTVTVKSRESDTYYEITIIDDGCGINEQKNKKDDKSHIGIINVKSRIEAMVNGKLEINSKLGEGTTAIIRIPK